MYTDIADWWPLLSRPEDYAEEAAFYARILVEASAERPKEILELGSGGGNNASHLKSEFSMTLVDMSSAMLEVSRKLNPECPHVEGDMRTVRLGREFDAVFVHDAIAYMRTIDDLSAAIATAFAHTRPGGVALFCPDHTRESFRPSTDHGGHDGHGRGLRYLEWTWDPDPTDSLHTADYAYMLRDRDGKVSVLYDRHECGLFGRAEWTEALATVGFVPSLAPFVHSEVEGEGVLFIGKKLTR